jgi:O-acetylhomoserine (thiol)-lyase
MKKQQSQYGFNTLAVHAGTAPDPTTGARSFPIFQTSSYVFDDADHAASLFNLQAPGFIYSRLTNPTVSALEEKLATLEGGRGGTVTSSGHAAETLALFPLMAPGMEVIVADKLYGGTINLMGKSYRKFGWHAVFVDTDDPEGFRRAVKFTVTFSHQIDRTTVKLVSHNHLHSRSHQRKKCQRFRSVSRRSHSPASSSLKRGQFFFQS